MFRLEVELTALENSSEYGILLNEDFLQHFPQKGRVRLQGTINNFPYNLAIQSDGKGGKYLQVGSTLRRRAKIKPGQFVELTAEWVDPNALDIPPALLEAMEHRPEGKAVFEALSIGKQRGLCHYVSSVDNMDSQIKRAFHILDKAARGELHTQGKKSD